MNKPYEFSKSVAVTLAQICTSPFGYLPQGSPTSPIISNMICSRMDTELRKLSKETRCVYTRYADDITFSSPKYFPASIAKIDYINEKPIVSIGDTLKEIIQKNGFLLNLNKIHLHNRGDRQEVCGLVVNKRLNVKRKLMKQVRALIYIWKTKNLIEKEKKLLSQRIIGKLNFIKFIRGNKDRAYRVLQNQYNCELNIPELPLEIIDEVKKSTWFLEVDGKPNGTAFVLNNELISCCHVTKSSKDIKACRWINNNKVAYKVSVIKENKALDLTKLKFDEFPKSQYYFSLEKSDSDLVKDKEKVTLAGFAYYTDQKIIIYPDAKILLIKKEIFPLFVIDPGYLIPGMSGGPAINENGKVIGVNVIGWKYPGDYISKPGDLITRDFYGVMPINFIDQV